MRHPSPPMERRQQVRGRVEFRSRPAGTAYYTDARGERWRIFDTVFSEGILERTYLEADRATHRVFVNRLDEVFVHHRLKREVFKLSPETCERQLAGAEPLPSDIRFDLEDDERMSH